MLYKVCIQLFPRYLILNSSSTIWLIETLVDILNKRPKILLLGNYLLHYDFSKTSSLNLLLFIALRACIVFEGFSGVVLTLCIYSEILHIPVVSGFTPSQCDSCRSVGCSEMVWSPSHTALCNFVQHQKSILSKVLTVFSNLPSGFTHLGACFISGPVDVSCVPIHPDLPENGKVFTQTLADLPDILSTFLYIIFG